MTAAVKERSAEDRVPVNGQCAKCGHGWVVAYTPLLIDAAVNCFKNATCPMCGATAKDVRLA